MISEKLSKIKTNASDAIFKVFGAVAKSSDPCKVDSPKLTKTTKDESEYIDSELLDDDYEENVDVEEDVQAENENENENENEGTSISAEVVETLEDLDNTTSRFDEANDNILSNSASKTDTANEAEEIEEEEEEEVTETEEENASVEEDNVALENENDKTDNTKSEKSAKDTGKNSKTTPIKIKKTVSDNNKYNIFDNKNQAEEEHKDDEENINLNKLTSLSGITFEIGGKKYSAEDLKGKMTVEIDPETGEYVIKVDPNAIEEEDEEKEEKYSYRSFKKLIKNMDDMDEILDNYNLKDIFSAIDEDEDGYITAEELKNAGFEDGLDDIEKEDIEDFIEEYDIKTKEEKSNEWDEEKTNEIYEKLKKLFEKDNQNSAQQNTSYPSGASGAGASGGTGSYGGGAVNSGGGVSGNSGAGTSAETSDTQPLTMDELLVQQEEKQAAVDDASGAVQAVYSGENAAVKEAQDAADEQKEIYDELLENDTRVSDELKTQKQENDAAIKEKEEAISEKETIIAEIENEIYTYDVQIANLNAQISALNSALSSLPEKTDDNKNRHEDIDSKASSFNSQIEELNKEVKQLEISKKEAEEELEDKGADTLEDDKKELEKLKKERDEIEEEITKNCSYKTTRALDKYQELREKVDTVKAEELEKANTDLTTAQSELEEVNAKINELKEAKIQAESKIAPKGQDVVDFALQFEGMSAAQMQPYIDAQEGSHFIPYGWCGAFCEFVTKSVYGANSTPFDYGMGGAVQEQEMCCPVNVRMWAEEKGIYTTDRSQVEPGDFVIYIRDGIEKHIGIVTSVNADGTVNTIEGNTHNDDTGEFGAGMVDQHFNKNENMGFVLMHLGA